MPKTSCTFVDVIPKYRITKVRYSKSVNISSKNRLIWDS